MSRPKYYKSGSKFFNYEIWGWHAFFISFSFLKFEIQLNRWGKNDES